MQGLSSNHFRLVDRDVICNFIRVRSDGLQDTREIGRRKISGWVKSACVRACVQEWVCVHTCVWERVLVRVCVCEGEREYAWTCVCERESMFVHVCVRDREEESMLLWVCLSVFVFVRVFLWGVCEREIVCVWVCVWWDET